MHYAKKRQKEKTGDLYYSERLARKNYLFAGSHKAAQKAALLYSFFATCKVNNIELYTWNKDVIEKIQEYKKTN